MVTTGQDQKLDIVDEAGQPALILSVSDIRKNKKTGQPGKTIVDVFTTEDTARHLGSFELSEEGKPVQIVPEITATFYADTLDVPVKFTPSVTDAPISVVIFPSVQRESVLAE